jgi:hypothetical protein
MATGKHAATLAARGYQSENAELQAILSGFEKKALENIHPFLSATALKPTPERIYHYTDFSGLHGILESGNLRFGDVFAMNDPSEVQHGMAESLRALRERVELTDSKVHRFFLDKYERFLAGGVRRSAHFQACCFSAYGDSLSQWRAYADNGAGYALCFDAAMLEYAYTHANGARGENRSVFHVTYDDEMLLTLQRSLIGSMYEMIALPESRELTPEVGGPFLRDLSTLASVHALHTSLYFKHEAYRDEGEYRFLTVEPIAKPLQGLKRRIRPHELVRFTEFDWRGLAKDSLLGVVIGPSAPARAEVFVRECLDEYHHRHLKLVRSTIPYRIPHR